MVQGGTCYSIHMSCRDRKHPLLGPIIRRPQLHPQLNYRLAEGSHRPLTYHISFSTGLTPQYMPFSFIIFEEIKNASNQLKPCCDQGWDLQNLCRKGGCGLQINSCCSIKNLLKYFQYHNTFRLFLHFINKLSSPRFSSKRKMFFFGGKHNILKPSEVINKIHNKKHLGSARNMRRICMKFIYYYQKSFNLTLKKIMKNNPNFQIFDPPLMVWVLKVQPTPSIVGKSNPMWIWTINSEVPIDNVQDLECWSKTSPSASFQFTSKQKLYKRTSTSPQYIVPDVTCHLVIIDWSWCQRWCNPWKTICGGLYVLDQTNYLQGEILQACFREDIFQAFLQGAFFKLNSCRCISLREVKALSGDFWEISHQDTKSACDRNKIYSNLNTGFNSGVHDKISLEIFMRLIGNATNNIRIALDISHQEVAHFKLQWSCWKIISGGSEAKKKYFESSKCTHPKMKRSCFYAYISHFSYRILCDFFRHDSTRPSGPPLQNQEESLAKFKPQLFSWGFFPHVLVFFLRKKNTCCELRRDYYGRQKISRNSPLMVKTKRQERISDHVILTGEP
ncbi:hypothetical protein VP01_605g3 [Puccinia sorghi]|uniref:Uncharacterized protein n=1 Tax=Puccinia sorghi TaxID=27349 RepID=A0A0L6UHA9_9BASI|nr:hypothetical protein VP01_605g3 [Puccinia sorghi]